MDNIIVTGGAGFLGTNLCRKLLLDSNNFVYCLDNLYSGNYSNISDLITKYPNNFKFICCDICNIELYKHLFSGNIKYIYNAACPASPPYYQREPIETTLTCVVGTQKLLELAKEYNAKFLQFSTSEIYGQPLVHPQSESYLGNVNTIGPRSCYDEGKRCAESLCADYRRLYYMDVRIIRIFNTYGPYLDKHDGRAISNFINQAITNDNITVFGDGSQTRSCCYVDDLIDGICKVMLSDSYIGPVNLGNPDERTILELAQLVIELTNSKSKIVFQDLPIDDPLVRKPDISRAQSLYNWLPKIDIYTGLRNTIEYYGGRL